MTLGLTVAASATDRAVQKTIHVSGSLLGSPQYW